MPAGGGTSIPLIPPLLQPSVNKKTTTVVQLICTTTVLSKALKGT